MRKTAPIWMAAALLLTACGLLRVGEAVLPEAGDLKEITVTADQLDLTTTDADAIAQLLELLRQSVRQSTGKHSIQDIPEKGAGLVRIDFGFKEGGTGTVFLYREDRLFLEQPYQGIYEIDNSLEEQFRLWVALELADSQTMRQEG